MNPENRNNIDVIPPLVRTRRVEVNRCCSFCRQQGHNIHRCNDERLTEFEVICANQVQNFETRLEFENWIIENYFITDNPVLVRSFAVRHCGANMRNSIDNCVKNISLSMFIKYKQGYNREPQQQFQRRRQIYNVENELIHILTRMRNDLPEFQEEEILNIEAAYREYFAFLLFNNFINNITQNRIEIVKLDISSTIENIAEEELHKKCECNICYEEFEFKNFVKLNCNHEFCKDCLIKSVNSDRRESPCCAFCRTEIKSFISRTNEVHSELANLVE